MAHFHIQLCHAMWLQWQLSIGYECALHATLAHEVAPVAPSGALHLNRVSGSQFFYDGLKKNMRGTHKTDMRVGRVQQHGIKRRCRSCQ